MNILNTTGYEMYNPSVVKAENCTLTDSDGKKYYDFEAGVWALPLGHNNARVNQALIKQLSQVSHVGYRYSHPVVEEAAQALLEIMKFRNGKCVFLCSGSEAVEYAVKAVQSIMKKPYLLKLDRHYLSAYGLSGDMKASIWKSVDWQSYIERNSAKEYGEISESQPFEKKRYDELLKDIPFDDIGAFIFECNTSGTAKLPPKELITAIASEVQVNKGYVIAEEVTSGMGRTGKWFGFEHYGIRPDVIACGKGLGNGYPVSAVGMSEEVAAQVARSGFHYAQSHQNDPLGCTAAREVITVIKEERLLDKAAENGNYLRAKLTGLMEKHPCIGEVRGVGLMCAVRFKDFTPASMLDIHRKLYEAGFIVGLIYTLGILRFYPPLTVEKYMIDGMIEAMDRIIE